MNRRRTRIIVEIALTVALATVLSMLTIWKMPQGGSISLGMLPIIVLAFRYGLGPGVAAGALFGIVNFIVDPFPPVHWVQLLLDYPVAHLLIGFAGIAHGGLSRALAAGTRSWITIFVVGGVAIGALGRYLAHFVSGMVFFGEFAPAGQPVWLYSAIYNLYVPLSALAALAAALVIVPILWKVAPVALDEGTR